MDSRVRDFRPAGGEEQRRVPDSETIFVPNSHAYVRARHAGLDDD